jgi:hypothetical protein
MFFILFFSRCVREKIQMAYEKVSPLNSKCSLAKMETIRPLWLFGGSCIDRVKNLHYQTMFTLSSLLFTKKKFQAGA